MMSKKQMKIKVRLVPTVFEYSIDEQVFDDPFEFHAPIANAIMYNNERESILFYENLELVCSVCECLIDADVDQTMCVKCKEVEDNGIRVS